MKDRLIKHALLLILVFVLPLVCAAYIASLGHYLWALPFVVLAGTSLQSVSHFHEG
ncbi:hypothetical protein PsAD37_03327 [Pseudovibrio sp. Ad37]|nr:hypothetical protein PsAD37_03327 [Pseudovibrio sp. Ad37]